MSEVALSRIEAVVIGASAGGVEALATLLPALDVRCQAIVLIVVHQPRERPSLLGEILATRCALPVREAVDKELLSGGTVHVAPPDYHLLVDHEEGQPPSLALSVDEPVHYSRPSIDVLFECAAGCWRNGLLAIILTGGNEDGVRGLQAVARAGGITVVQDPREAVAPALPAAAVRTGMARHVLPLDGIRALLGKVGHPA